MGGWPRAWLKPGFAVACLSGANSGISVAFTERPFALQAASSRNSSPKQWNKMLWAGAVRFLPAGSKTDCVFPGYGTKWWEWEGFRLLLCALGLELIKSGWETAVAGAQAPVCRISDQAWMAQ